jgi:hypothetical protein
MSFLRLLEYTQRKKMFKLIHTENSGTVLLIYAIGFDLQGLLRALFWKPDDVRYEGQTDYMQIQLLRFPTKTSPKLNRCLKGLQCQICF